MAPKQTSASRFGDRGSGIMRRACKFAGGLNERREGSRWIFPARVIQREWRQTWGPIFENMNESASGNVVPHVSFHHITEPNSILCSDPNQAWLIERKRALHIDLH
jgi:hypothetical protein